MGFLTWIVVGLIGGWLARKVMEGSRYGVLLDIFLGIVGSIAGGWTLALLGIRGIGTIIVSFLGAVFLVWISRLITARPEEVEVKEIVRPAEDSAPPPQRIQAASLVGWPTTGSHSGFESLVSSVADVVGKPPPAVTPASHYPQRGSNHLSESPPRFVSDMFNESPPLLHSPHSKTRTQ